MFNRLRYTTRLISITLAALLVAACGGSGGGASEEPKASTTPMVIVTFGDSLTSEDIFITPGSGWVNLLRQRLAADGVDSQQPVTVFNEGRGGETTSQALSRISTVLTTYKPTHIVLAHGTNDIWWDCPGCFAQTRANLAAMANAAKAAGAKVVFADITLRLRSETEAAAYTAMVQGAAADTGSEYAHMVANVPFDNTNYYPDKVHLTDAAQPALTEAVARALYRLVD